MGNVGGRKNDPPVRRYVSVCVRRTRLGYLLRLLGSDLNEPISCMAMEGKAIWVSSGTDVIKYGRGKEVM